MSNFMIKMKAALDVKNSERNYSFVCDQDAPLGEIHDALCQMKAYIVKRIQDADKPKEESPQLVEV